MVHRRATDDESRHADEIVRERTPAPPSATEDVLDLQRTAGNAAVARAIAARQPAATEAEPLEEQLDRAFFVEDWDRVVALAPRSKPLAIQRIGELEVEELRYLDDAIRRADQEGSWLAKCVKSQFDAKKVPAKQQAPGAGHGKVEAKQKFAEDGDSTSRPRKNARYRFEIGFTPNYMTIGGADEIGFIQTARVVDLATGANRSPHGRERTTPDGTHVDRLEGKEQGWYGMTDEGGSRAKKMRLWQKSDWDEPAWMEDTPSTAKGNKEYHFETAIVCRKGFNAGKVYATVQWGFEIDNDLVITPYEHEIFHKETAGFREAVDAWNAQAAGPEEKRNADNQQRLPTNFR
jgi:hypothetical protein